MTALFSDISMPKAVSGPAVVQDSVSVKEAIPATRVDSASTSDSVEIKSKSKKKGPIKALKGFISKVKKFFSTSGEYIKGTAKGIATGAVAGSIVYTAGGMFNGIRQGMANRAAKRSGEEVAKVVKKVPNKFLGAVVALGALVANIWTASLNATEKQSKIDMRWTGIEPKK